MEDGAHKLSAPAQALFERYPEAATFDAEGRPVGLVKRKACWRDVLDAPEGFKAELIMGGLHMQPAAAPRHNRAQRVLSGRIGGPFDDDEAPGGWWIVTEPQLKLRDDAFQPDLAGWRRVRMPDFPDGSHFALSPDWICEILSPSTASYDRGEKKDAYARHGVAHLWHVDPIAQRLEAFKLVGAHYELAARHEGEESAAIAPFEAVALELGKLWSLQ